MISVGFKFSVGAGRNTIVTAAAAALLALYWWLAVSASIEKSQTSDEVAHLVAGYAYDRFGDFRLQPENGVLPQRLYGLPALADQARLSNSPDDWAHARTWQLGWDFLYAENNLTDWLLLRARALNALFGVALGALIFAVARARHGAGGGLVALACFALAPNFLAHGGFATSDIMATLFLTLAPWLFWRHLARRDLASGLLAALAGGCALAAKHNGVLLGPMYAVLVVADLWIRGYAGERSRRLAGDVGFALVQGVGAVFVLWAFFNFRYAMGAPELPEIAAMPRTWESMTAPTLGLAGSVIGFAREWHLLPEAWLYGFGDVLLGAQTRPMFLAGEHSALGWWQFFPALFLAKTPLAVLVGLVAGFAFALRRRDFSRLGDDTLPLIVSAGVIGVFALTSHLNIGDRHILGVYPILFVALGGLVHVSRGALLAILLVAGTAWESFSIRPHYLASFNALSGGPARAYRLAADSSLDWGQDLPALARWLTANRAPGEKLYLGYFGNAWPPHYDVRPTYFLPATNYIVRPPIVPYAYEPGLYCVSATVLNEVYDPYRGPWTPAREESYEILRNRFSDTARLRAAGGAPPGYEVFDQLRLARLCKYLQDRTPDGNAGYSILIFRLTAAELQTVLDGPVTGGHPVKQENRP